MTNKTRFFSYIAIFSAIYLLGLSTGLVFFADREQGNYLLASGQENETTKGFSIDQRHLKEVYKILEAYYYDREKIDPQKMSYGIAKGLVDSLEDPYSVFMDPKQTKEFNRELNGELQGIGAELTVRNQFLVVQNPLKNSPAEKAGLKPGDVILKIDQEPAADMTLFEAVMSIRGEEGSKVVLTIKRENIEFDVEIIREKVILQSVEVREEESGIWNITVNQFSDDTKSAFEKALNDIKDSAKGIILDLRYNGGGFLEGAVDIASPLLEGKKTIMTVKYRDSSLNETYYSKGNGIITSSPLVVLVNESSASAAEIVAAAIKDHNRGILIGTKTFGKGSVQEVDPLRDGSSLRFTVAKWYSPSGKSYDQEGLMPDFVVEKGREDHENQKDPQLSTAIEYLKSVLE